MFIYLVALVATLFIIFAFAHGRPSAESLRSTIRHPQSLYNRVIFGPANEITVSNEDLPIRRSLAAFTESTEYEGPAGQTRRILLTNRERSADEVVKEDSNKWKNLGLHRYSLENILKEEIDRNINLAAARALRPESSQSDSTKASKQETMKDNMLESLQSSIPKTTVIPPARFNTAQIYNLMLQEKLKGNAAQPRSMESDKKESNASLSDKSAEHLISSSERNEIRFQREEDPTRVNGTSNASER